MLTILNDTHLNLFLELKENNPGQWKLGSEFDLLFSPKDLYINTLMHKQSYTVGWIENNRLLSIGSLFEAQDSPVWLILYYANIKTNFYSYEKLHGHTIMSELFQESLKRKLTSCVIVSRADFVSVYSQKSEKMKQRLENNFYRLTPEVKMYDWVDDAIIPANTMPKYDYMQSILFRRTWAFDLIIRRGNLKQEHRKDLIYT